MDRLHLPMVAVRGWLPSERGRLIIVRMNVAIVGYGRMGHEVESALRGRGHSVAVRISPNSAGAEKRSVTEDALRGADAVIEFGVPSVVVAHCTVYARAGVDAVVGTTGWDDALPEVRAMVERAGIGYLSGSNFSIGAHIFFALAGRAAAMLNAVPDYDAYVIEQHHRMKKDSPSGTAISLANIIVEQLDRKTRVRTESVHGLIAEEELHVASVRGGAEPGTHTMVMDSPADTIEIRHRARNRSGFAIGAVMAAEWLKQKPGFHTVEDFVSDLLTRVGEK